MHTLYLSFALLLATTMAPLPAFADGERNSSQTDLVALCQSVDATYCTELAILILSTIDMSTNAHDYGAINNWPTEESDGPVGTAGVPVKVGVE